MNIREGIRQALLANAALVAIVGQRITSHYAPANTPAGLTWIVMTKISGGEEGAHDGDQMLTHPTFQFTVGGGSQENVDEAVRLLLGMQCTEYVYNEGSNEYRLTFIHSDDRDAQWDGNTRVSEASVDFTIWTNK